MSTALQQIIKWVKTGGGKVKVSLLDALQNQQFRELFLSMVQDACGNPEQRRVKF